MLISRVIHRASSRLEAQSRTNSNLLSNSFHSLSESSIELSPPCKVSKIISNASTRSGTRSRFISNLLPGSISSLSESPIKFSPIQTKWISTIASDSRRPRTNPNVLLSNALYPLSASPIKVVGAIHPCMKFQSVAILSSSESSKSLAKRKKEFPKFSAFRKFVAKAVECFLCVIAFGILMPMSMVGFLLGGLLSTGILYGIYCFGVLVFNSFRAKEKNHGGKQKKRNHGGKEELIEDFGSSSSEGKYLLEEE